MLFCICFLKKREIFDPDFGIYFTILHSIGNPLNMNHKDNYNTPIIDREIFFGNPEISQGQISPDGKYLAFIKPYQEVRNIWIKPIEAPFESAKPITADTIRPIPGYFWSHDSKYILYVQDKGGNEDFHVFAVNPFDETSKIPAAKNLTAIENVKAVIVRVPETEPDSLYIGLNDGEPSWHDLYKVSISSGERTLCFENTEQINGWIFDLEDQLRLATRSTDGGGTQVLIITDKGLEPCYECSAEEDCHVLRYHKDGQRVYMATNKGKETDLSQLILFNPVTREEEFVESDPEGRVDFGNAIFSELTDTLIATVYEGDRTRYYFKDEQYEKDYQYLKSQLGRAEISFGSSTKDELQWIIFANSDVDPGTAYRYDRSQQALTFQYRPRPNLPKEHLAPMQAVRYRSFDGLEISAYLTTPSVKDTDKLPAILLVHGGPWARDYWGFDSYAQFLANRGYLVLQPNFRGSTGYGKAFLNAANGQWGEKMQDDVSAGVQYLVENGLADPKRIGIVGGSYGGYATLAGLTFTPDLYAAGVSIVGPSSLLTLLASIPPYWETVRKLFYKRIANPETPEGKAQLKRQSPLFHAHQIKAPLLVVQGANDPRVKKAESDQVVIALRELNLPVEYLLAPDEGHGFVDPINNMAFIAAMEKFLAKHLGGRYQESIPPHIAKRLEELTVNVQKLALPKPVTVNREEITFPAVEDDLTPSKHYYRMTIFMGDENIPISFERVIEEKDGRWMVSDKAKALMGEIEDVALLEKWTLRPIQQKMIQGPAKIVIKYSEEEIMGDKMITNQDRPFRVTCNGRCVGAGVARTVTLQQLPLKEGYELVYLVFDPQVQQVVPYQAKVVGREILTINGKEIETYKVENRALELGGETNLKWFTVEKPRYLVRSESTLPLMGAVFLFELDE